MSAPLAFPVPNVATDNGDCGMLLRDWFAGQALIQTAMVSHAHEMSAIQVGSPMHPKMAAQAAYRFADAMMAERIKS